MEPPFRVDNRIQIGTQAITGNHRQSQARASNGPCMCPRPLTAQALANRTDMPGESVQQANDVRTQRNDMQISTHIRCAAHETAHAKRFQQNAITNSRRKGPPHTDSVCGPPPTMSCSTPHGTNHQSPTACHAQRVMHRTDYSPKTCLFWAVAGGVTGFGVTTQSAAMTMSKGCAAVCRT